jgi:hypothetical protein
MPSVVDLCNKALDKLGHGPIASLDDNTKAARLCTRNWPLVRDAVLRAHPWNFAIKRDVLAPVDLTVTEAAKQWGFSNKFPFPADMLRLVEVRDLSTSDYQVEGRAILANTTVLYIRYVGREEDPNQYDALFFDAAAAHLAFELAEPLTQSNTKKDAAWQEYKDRLSDAKQLDGQENPPAQFEEDEWIAVRY